MNMHAGDEVEYSEEVLVSGSMSSMRAKMVSYTGIDEIAAFAGSIAAVCEARRVLDDIGEHDQTKRLLIQHIADKYGKE